MHDLFGQLAGTFLMGKVRTNFFYFYFESFSKGQIAGPVAQKVQQVGKANCISIDKLQAADTLPIEEMHDPVCDLVEESCLIDLSPFIPSLETLDVP